ncbi:MAG: hypothetical protein HGA44_21060 [Cellulomonadaceae bacterium]|nr:hypothetical protein [Cellulomonadaceae bacterium]
MTFASPRWRVLLALVATLAGAGLAVAAPAQAEETAAWSAAPADATGTLDGRTRFELEVAPGAPLEEHVLVTNSSTVEREFSVYGADGFNTPLGGYDVGAAALAATDVGAWVAVATPTVTIAPLSTAVVAFTVTVPDGATPGDHPGGIVVSPVRAQVTDAGVLVDTRVAVRLNVRVPGEVAAALEVRSVTGGYGFTAVPFASAPATVTYEVVNTGNVKVVGVPRVRITGPFGVSLAEVEAEQTHEVLPGGSFTVTTTLPGVAPVGWTTAVVDVEMAAAPGPDTEIPLVSSTARTTLFAISWTTLAAVVVLVLVVWFVVRRIRRRRLEGTQMWSEMVEEARKGLEVGTGTARPATSGGSAVGTALLVAAGLAVVVGSLTLTAVPSQAAVRAADGSDDGGISLTVPSAPGAPAPTTSPAPTASGTRSGSSSGTRPATSSIDDVAAVEAPAAAAEGADAAIVGVAAQTGPAPDLQWTGGRWTPTQWALLALGGAGVLGALGALGHTVLAGRRAGGVA